MQYFRPAEPFFVGDCMPFFHADTFHLYYLRDENHHQAKGGLGGHQWAHASSQDLVHWAHHPLAIPITQEWEGSICTGSVFYHAGTYYAFYATRRPDRTQHLSLAVSADGVHFAKTLPNPLASPQPGYATRHYRDPCVFRDPETGRFHMLVTASREDYPLAGRGGCLAHLVSHDLHTWQVVEPFLMRGSLGVPECPDHFCWHGWYYLLFSYAGVAHYRLARHPFGPWLRPRVDTFDGPAARVLKTAAFTGNRRLGVAFLGTREGDHDGGRWQYAGHALFRELVQHADGTLGTRFPPEMIPASGEPLALSWTALTPAVLGDAQQVSLMAPEGISVAAWDGVPRGAHLTAHLVPQPHTAAFGLRLRGAGAFESGYDLRFLPALQRVTLHDQTIEGVEGLDRPVRVEIILKEDILDVCIDQHRCLVNRCPELRGERLFAFCEEGGLSVEELVVRPLR